MKKRTSEIQSAEVTASWTFDPLIITPKNQINFPNLVEKREGLLITFLPTESLDVLLHIGLIVGQDIEILGCDDRQQSANIIPDDFLGRNIDSTDHLAELPIIENKELIALGSAR